MSGQLPTVFVSSTFYDLRQIRSDLCDFVEKELGFRFLASEHPSFPVDPDVSTIENCRRQVEHGADILLLVVGGRYGSVDPRSRKSVTNLEYLTARAKGIPIYCFVQREILAIYPVWQANPDGNFEGHVDTPRLFDFIHQIRSEDAVWVFPFNGAQEISSVLRTQLAYLMKRGLDLQLRLHGQSRGLPSLKGEAFRIVLEKPPAWVPSLFAQLVIDEVDAREDKRRAYGSAIAFGSGERIEHLETAAWLQSKLDEAKRIVEGLKSLEEHSMNAAFSANDARLIAYSAHEVGNAYDAILDWAATLRRAHIKDIWQPLAAEVSRMLGGCLEELENLGPRLKAQVSEALNGDSKSDATIVQTIKLDVVNTERVNEEIAKLQVRGLW